ncbi:MAG: insulinase family protein [Saprospiraceae bacterium]|nr:insulinase family protein [Saprospiraceae bacterium]
MKNLITLVFFLFIAEMLHAQYQTVKKTSADGKYSYKVVTGDPTQTRFYTLKNGLQVILHENRNEPKIMTLITTRAGGKNDPSTNTGLAHYLEHLMFKGTGNLGTMDYAKEKIYLNQIDDLYEVYRQTTDQDKRKSIYKQIDSISTLASKIAIPNEYDKAMSAVGSNMTNAFTSFEMTAYMENIPSNNLEKFLNIQDERFTNPVFRLFHTELETVYEEKNISLDNGQSKVFEGMFSGLFSKHPYGTQTILGAVDHLKNPSIKTIRNFYNTYYVPNNMVVILAGDINADETIGLVDKYFGDWKTGNVPKFTFESETPATEPKEMYVQTPDEESVAIGFRMPNKNDKEAILADLTSAILYNGKSGLIDKNLVNAQKVLEGYGFNYLLTDYGLIYFGGKALQGQTLKEVRQLVLDQIEALKKGNFDESLIQATVNNQKVNKVREQENPMWMAFTLNDLFSTGTPWENYLRDVDNMGKVTKQDIVNFANKWFGNNHMTVYKLTGKDTTVQKVIKPEITALEINRSAQSEFLRNITATPNPPLKPVFLDYQKDIQFGALGKDVPIWQVPNKNNKLFDFYYVFDMGSFNIKKLPLAVEYLKLIGSQKKSNEQINKELYNLAVDFNIFTSNEQVYVSMSGLEENREKALAIIEDLMRNPKPDQDALYKMIEAKIKQRNDNTLNKNSIFWSALNNYVDYGAKNPYNDVLSNQEMRSIKATEMTDLIKSLFGYKHKVYYYGPTAVPALTAQLKKAHKVAPKLKDYPPARKYEPAKTTDENNIYFVNYDMIQTDISLQRWDEAYDVKKTPIVAAFNEYYGGSMSSVVFQEIREAKALAYSTYGFYSPPVKKEDKYKAGFYVGTQADKLSQAFDAMNDLIQTMPESEKNWDIGRTSIKQNIEANRITKTNILFNYQTALKRGLNYDTRKDVYQSIDNITLADIKNFHGDHMKDKKWNIRVIGDKTKLNMSDLAKYGKVVELNLKDIFGYEVESKVLKP